MNQPLSVLIIEDSSFDAMVMVNVLEQGIQWSRAGRNFKGTDPRVGAWVMGCDSFRLQFTEFSAPEALEMIKQSGLIFLSSSSAAIGEEGSRSHEIRGS